MQILQRVDLAFLMNVVGSLTAISEAEFQGYNGECPEEVGDFLIALLAVLKDEENDNTAGHSFFAEGTIARQVSSCYIEHPFFRSSYEIDQVCRVW